MNLENIFLVRLTRLEWDQLRLIPMGISFWHVNLEHKGISRQTAKKKYLATLILKNGVDTVDRQVEPELDLKNTINLKLLRLIPSVRITKLEIPAGQICLLANPNGIIDSLVDRYSQVRGISREQIEISQCYIREFVKV